MQTNPESLQLTDIEFPFDTRGSLLMRTPPWSASPTKANSGAEKCGGRFELLRAAKKASLKLAMKSTISRNFCPFCVAAPADLRTKGWMGRFYLRVVQLKSDLAGGSASLCKREKKQRKRCSQKQSVSRKEACPIRRCACSQVIAGRITHPDATKLIFHLSSATLFQLYRR